MVSNFGEAMMEVYVKVMWMGRQCLVAACDADLLGKTLKFGRINFEVRREFYEGSLVNVREAVELIRNASNINLIGSKIISEALREGLIHPQAILDISGVPHTQIVRL